MSIVFMYVKSDLWIRMQYLSVSVSTCNISVSVCNIYLHTCTHISAHRHEYRYVCICMHMHMYKHACTCICTYKYACIYAYIHIYTYIYDYNACSVCRCVLRVRAYSKCLRIDLGVRVCIWLMNSTQPVSLNYQEPQLPRDQCWVWGGYDQEAP